MKNYIKYTFIIDDTEFCASIDIPEKTKEEDLKLRIDELNQCFDNSCLFRLLEALREKLEINETPKNKKIEIIVEFNINNVKETKILNEYMLFPYPENQKIKYEYDVLRNIYQDFKIYRSFPLKGRINEILENENNHDSTNL